MKQRAELLGDTGVNAPCQWDSLWDKDDVHVWLGINGRTREALIARQVAIQATLDETGGATVLAVQDAAAEVIES